VPVCTENKDFCICSIADNVKIYQYSFHKDLRIVVEVMQLLFFYCL